MFASRLLETWAIITDWRTYGTSGDILQMEQPVSSSSLASASHSQNDCILQWDIIVLLTGVSDPAKSSWISPIASLCYTGK